MTELLWQATLLLAVAFFFGAVFACGLKRRYYYGRAREISAPIVSSTPHRPAPDEPRIEVAPRAVADDDRFERAISGQTTPAPAPVAPVAVAAAAAPARTTAASDFIPPTPAPETGPTFIKVAPAPKPAPAPTPVAAPSPAAAPAPVAPVAAAAVPAATVSGDDFTRIRAINAHFQRVLNDAGFHRYSDLGDVMDWSALEKKLGLAGHIGVENWTGQARVLASGQQTYYALRADRGDPVPPFTVPPPARPAPPSAKPAVACTLPRQPSAEPADDLQRVRGIDGEIESALNELGVRRFDELASFNSADVQFVSERLDLDNRIVAENWIGQARMLAAGETTYYTLLQDRAAAAVAAAGALPPAADPVAEHVEPQIEPPALAPFIAEAPTEPEAAVASEHAPPAPVMVDAGPESVVAAPVADAEPEELGDDFARIRGIDAGLRDRLKKDGIWRFHDLATLTRADVEELEARHGLAIGRIEAQNWLGQAHILATGGETYYSRRVDSGVPVPDDAVPEAEIVAAPMPSVGEPAEPGTLPRSGAPRGPSDDLTRVRGIDADIQRHLNEQGIRHFADLASLNATDVETVASQLRLGNRITEENWLGQAHVLATGGETYYARRIDTTSNREPEQGAASVAPAITEAAPVSDIFAQVDAAPAEAPTFATETLPAGAFVPEAAAPARSVQHAGAASDVNPLRSVRSEALLGTDAVGAPLRHDGKFDDLKRIRGIGVLIEKKLNQLGICYYEQIANWTSADVERISNILDFKGRIERESWIEQARILGTGGQTEFSRRGDS